MPWSPIAQFPGTARDLLSKSGRCVIVKGISAYSPSIAPRFEWNLYICAFVFVYHIATRMDSL